VLQEVVKHFSSAYSATNLLSEERKVLENLALLLAYLYNFRIVGAQLVFDLLGRLADSFQPKDLDLVLVMLRNAGFTLRKDDPALMKAFITKVQVKLFFIFSALFYLT
jgi:nucleolar MIF4G domain-containing protein 1